MSGGGVTMDTVTAGGPSTRDRHENKTHAPGGCHGDRPRVSYISLISKAILSSPEKKMLLSDIYRWIQTQNSGFEAADRSWRNSVRHNLSLNECFVKAGVADNGKSHYWAIHQANQRDFERGDFRRRHARRLVRAADDDTTNCTTMTDDWTRSKVGQPIPAQNTYVPMTVTLMDKSTLIEMFGVDAILTPDEQMDITQQMMTSPHNVKSLSESRKY